MSCFKVIFLPSLVWSSSAISKLFCRRFFFKIKFPFNSIILVFKTLIQGMLMQSNRPQAKFHFKSDSYRVLIDFFDPKSLLYLIKMVATIQIRTRIWSKKSIFIENSLNLIENGSNLIKNGSNWIENGSNLINNVENPVVFNHFWLKLTFLMK